MKGELNSTWLLPQPLTVTIKISRKPAMDDILLIASIKTTNKITVT